MPKEDYEVLETAVLQKKEGDKYVDAGITVKITRKKSTGTRSVSVNIDGVYYTGFFKPVLTRQDYQDLEKIRRERK